jgi:putative ABC transport system permease protein
LMAVSTWQVRTPDVASMRPIHGTIARNSILCIHTVSCHDRHDVHAAGPATADIMAKNIRHRLSSWLVRMLPLDMREAHGVDMRQTLADGDRDRPRGFRSAVAFWLNAFVETARVAPRLHADALAQDVRYAWRGFRRSPAFAIAAVMTIALGTGATLAVFIVVNGVLLRPLAFTNPAQLALVWAVDSTGSRTWMSPPELDDLSTRATNLDAIAGLTDLKLALTGNGSPEELDVVAASATLFPLLGVSPHIGRLFEATDDLETAARTVVLSHALWVRRFGGAHDVLGRSIVLDGRSYLVIGVLPRSFGLMPLSSVFPQHADAWLALQPHLVSRARDVRYLHLVGRVRADVPFGAAREEIASIGRAVSHEFADAYRGRRWSFDAVRLQDDIVSGVRPALLVLMGTVAMVLSIGCVNVAALLIARGTGRRREMAVRVALGASRGRLVRQLLTEAFLLAAAGGGIGLLLAAAAPQVARTPAIGSLPRFADLSIDLRVLVVAIGVAAVSAVVFALAPSLELSNAVPSRRGGSVRISRLLAGAEIALAAAVLVLALLFARSLATLIDIDPGFDTSRAVTARVSLPPKYSTASAIAGFFDEALLRLARLPGVDSTAAITQLPLSGSSLGSSFTAEGSAQESSRIDVDLRGVTPGYFTTMGIPVLRGRGFTE